jgi:hypothetical protein
LANMNSAVINVVVHMALLYPGAHSFRQMQRISITGSDEAYF